MLFCFCFAYLLPRTISPVSQLGLWPSSLGGGGRVTVGWGRREMIERVYVLQKLEGLGSQTIGAYLLIKKGRAESECSRWIKRTPASRAGGSREWTSTKWGDAFPRRSAAGQWPAGFAIGVAGGTWKVQMRTLLQTDARCAVIVSTSSLGRREAPRDGLTAVQWGLKGS